jgi:hypothetical protein
MAAGAGLGAVGLLAPMLLTAAEAPMTDAAGWDGLAAFSFAHEVSAGGLAARGPTGSGGAAPGALQFAVSGLFPAPPAMDAAPAGGFAGNLAVGVPVAVPVSLPEPGLAVVAWAEARPARTRRSSRKRGRARRAGMRRPHRRSP